ncbi:MAG: CHASE2 domain-containing protein [Drouetiella hepatica Uher 2000/2452]|jgi:CHASE2 domain-containing sensor protein|uniref:CHASE2 domain-containing protein n=1 Tax=Drouetiella hepatica Uher 2000/2452 TaxID=904376 RepID=A0A951UN74_9CYAN|nr:CHASE2 domain-containing protein [Drouetiella hepatica Uher 2000/2452]
MAGKLAVLKFGEGSLETGFPVALQISEEQVSEEQIRQQDTLRPGLAYYPLAEVAGKLPPAPDLLRYYQHWQSTYRQLGTQTRLEAPKAQVTNVSMLTDCQSAAEALSDRFNTWLRSESFRPLREKWLELLSPQDSIRVILQTDDSLLQRLPWQTWELSDRYTQSEFALSLPSYEQIGKTPNVKDRLKILAILGNSQGIDIQSDRALLEQLPDADIHFLVEPQRQELTDQLWAQPWDILFFAGHSKSDLIPPPLSTPDSRLPTPDFPTPDSPSADLGRIFINATDSLTIRQLRYGLRQAVERGLKLAIFNSCDGLGLARNLADLQIPQMIVMREPVPDRVAQEFLKSFLSSFSQGEPFYQSVRQARERLQGLEDQFPCATWLPIICQNPAEAPPTWKQLMGQKFTGQKFAGQKFIGQDVSLASEGTIAPLQDSSRAAPQKSTSPVFRHLRQASKVLISGLLVTAALTGLRYAGFLQPSELQAFDALMRLRPAESEDSRLLIVTINDREKQQYGGVSPNGDRISLTDRFLDQLLTRLNQAQPSVIGLDLYRDFPAEPAVAQQFRQQQIVSVCKAQYPGEVGIAPAPDSPPNQVGFSDFVADSDDKLRRHLLAMTTPYIDPDAPCTAAYAFNLQIASRYLLTQRLPMLGAPDTDLRFGKTVLRRLKARTSGYQPVDDRGNQILLNYRSTPFLSLSLTDLLSGKVNPSIIKDRIVLVGVAAESSTDFWDTPIDPHMPGVVAQAHMVSQIVNAALEGRSLLWVWSWQEIPWILGWALWGSLLGWRLRSPLRLSLAISLSTLAICGICWGVLLQGGWIPLIPALLALAIASIMPLFIRFPLKLARNRHFSS